MRGLSSIFIRTPSCTPQEKEIRECLRQAEECNRLSKTALTPSGVKDYLDMEKRWLNLARSYEFAERLSDFTKPFGAHAPHKK